VRFSPPRLKTPTFFLYLSSLISALRNVRSSFLVTVMSDEYYLPEDFQRGRVPRHASRYDILQPQCKQPSRPVAARDRYRATQYDNPMYDIVEDDNTYGKGTQFDPFGMQSSLTFIDDGLLQQPYPDRQRQAVPGKARLSLAAPSQSQPSYYARANIAYDGRGKP
jgi:ATP-dependent DNA helicase HFM1/MER3